MTNVVVVESPAKAKTINKYLGADYTVLASYGHIRDLPSKDGSVNPDDEFSMTWQIDSRSKKHVDEIVKAAKRADAVFLATDPDREGEAISWHIKEVLRDRKALDGKEVKRVVFNEITKSAINDAFDHPRDLDQELIDAYMARRALDYLVGFNLSPVLWRKLPGSRSAGRVQSVALRLICDRELEIEKFVADEYWSIDATFKTPRGETFEASLTHLDGEKLEKLSLGSEQVAMAAVSVIEAHDFSIGKVEKKQTRRHPSPPFTTSTMQQEASRKLYFPARKTMQVAQQLYEGVQIGGETVGLITYMRTDGVQMAREAIASCRNFIQETHGSSYVPNSPREYKSKAKNAQEAHEACRPTDIRRTPDDVAKHVSPDQLKLYTLIWKRTLASQMEAAVLDQVGVDLITSDKSATLRATGSVIAFDGFMKLYRESRDERKDDENGRILPEMSEGEAVERLEVNPEQHFTQPPPRFSEASLVKKLEELGIGRPSTYASIISVLQDRNYVQLESRRFIPEDRGRLVTTFLASFFEQYVEYGFTAELEEKLDDISGGRIDWKRVLVDFWIAFKSKIEETKDLTVRDVLNVLNDELEPHFFPERADGSAPRSCPKCKEGELSIKLGKHGAFLGCSRYPDCNFTTPLGTDPAQSSMSDGPRELGTDPETSKSVTLREGPYGIYVQLGEAEQVGRKKTKPKRASLPKGMDPESLDLQKALALLSLPRFVGIDPQSGMEIRAGIGRFGPFIQVGGTYASLKDDDDDVLTIGLNRAVALLGDKPRKAPPKELGNHPKNKKPIMLKEGRWGPFVQHGRTMARLPKDMDKDALTLEDAIALIDAKSDGGKGTTKKKAAPKKKKAAPKKAAST